jgi:F0F1-type ATP synthase assembly protein I
VYRSIEFWAGIFLGLAISIIAYLIGSYINVSSYIVMLVILFMAVAVLNLLKHFSRRTEREKVLP